MDTEGHFAVIGSCLTRRGDAYRVSIYSHGYKEEEQINVGIVSKDEEFQDHRQVSLKGTSLQHLDFQIGPNQENNLNLNVKNCTGEYFDEIRSLHMNTKKFSVFIQTDKSVYKPSDIVKFRVFVVDAETKPFKFDQVDIYITDGADNRVKQFDNPASKFRRGVFEDELQLSDLPVMGLWRIRVKINGDDETIKTFDVDEYVLPKFEVSIDANPNVVFKDSVIRATVKAKYTFGKIAKGSATVTAQLEDPYAMYHYAPIENNSKKVSKTVAVDGKNFVEFNFKKELEVRDNYSDYVVILKATFKDELSGKEASAETKVKIHKDEYKLELKKSAGRFRPGLPFHVTVSATSNRTGAPVTDEVNPVKFTVTSFYDVLRKVKTAKMEDVGGRTMHPGDDYECWEENYRDEEFKVFLVNGKARIDVNVLKDTTQFSVEVKYRNIGEYTSRISKADSVCRQYVQARILNDCPKLSEPIQIEVLSSEPIQHFNYQVIGSGKVLESKLEAFEPKTSHIFELKPSISMLPKCEIVVYYMAGRGEIVSDKLEVEFAKELINQVNLKLSSEQAKPGEELTISVDTKPNSFVGLLGVDQSVLLLKKGNDIEQGTVLEELEKYGKIDEFHHGHFGETRLKDFENCVMITNGASASEKRNRAYKCQAYTGFRGKTTGLFGAVAEHVVLADEVGFGAAAGQIPQKAIEIRKEFPETWLFDSLEFDAGASKTLTKKVPDTITSWIITGFSLDPTTGLGLTKQPSKLNVFQPFFVTTNLPYSIKRGEVVSIPVIVFNYLDSDQQATVTLFNSDQEFEFVDAENGESYSKEVSKKTEVSIQPEQGVTVSFIIRPLKVGHITIKVIAESAMAGDGVERPLKVEPEGVTQFLNEAVLIDLRNETEFKKSIEIVVPEEAVPDSTRIEASAIGDILGPTIENLDKLIKLPYGCGEQNMLNFVPNIVVLDYLTNLKKLSPEIEAKAKRYMESGYQRELTYKHDDGSYSAFGKGDKKGSTWLTAFVAKSFNQASKYIKIDPNITLAALNFLAKTQEESGAFPENGEVFHRDMQGGSSNGIALTSYVLITFLEAQVLAKKFENEIKKALDNILKNLNSIGDPYTLAITSYALQLAGHEKKIELLEKLNQTSINKDSLKYWTKEEPEKPQESGYWHRKPNSVNVEMSAYALQAYILADRDSDAIPIMKWLITQRNENGGFQSTQDTVVGLQALSKLATKIQVTDGQLKISVKPQSSSPAEININSGNSLILQKHELPSNERHFDVSATGNGFSILQISYRYNLDNSGKFPRFQLAPKVDSSSNKEFLHLHVCTSFVPDEKVERSNMAVMEVSLPSGFTFDNDHLSELLATEKVKKVETKDGDTVVMVYFDDIGSSEICPQFKAYRTHAVAKQKPAPIIIYDYYDNSRCARTFFEIPEISITDIAAV